MDEEPLSAWADRRDRRRNGRLRATTLGAGPHGTHVNPDAPRLISRWNGYEWEAVTVVANLADCKRFLYPKTADTDPLTPAVPPPTSFGGGTGRHRGPPPAADD